MIVIRVAGLSVGLDNAYPYVETLAKDYLTTAPPDFTVRATPDQLRAEALVSGEEYPPGYLESIVLYRHIACMLPRYGGAVFHGSVIAAPDGAYAVTARSGVGKTTHTRLWLSEFGDVYVLNGDKPILRYIDGTLYASGTPWRGKEGYGVPGMLPLRGIAFLERGAENSAVPVEPAWAIQKFLTQIYMPPGGAEVVATLRFADRVLRDVRLVRLQCNKEPEAAHVARAALIPGEDPANIKKAGENQ